MVRRLLVAALVAVAAAALPALAASPAEELEAVERLIELERRKIELLKAVREGEAQCEGGGECEVASGYALVEEPGRHEAEEGEGEEEEEEEGEHAEDDQDPADRFERLAEWRSDQRDVTAAAVVTMTMPKTPQARGKRGRRPVFAGVVVGGEAGLEVSTLQGDVLLRVPLGARVTAMDTSRQGGARFVAAALADGSARLYQLRAWPDDDGNTARVALEPLAEVPPYHEVREEPRHPARGRSLRLAEGTLYALPGTPRSRPRERPTAPAAGTSVAIHSRRRTVRLFLGFSNGVLRVHDRNGTLRAELVTNSTAPVAALAVAQQGTSTLGAFATRDGVATFKADKPRDLLDAWCAGLPAVTSLAFDEAMPTTLLAGTSDGRVLSINTRLKRGLAMCSRVREARAPSARRAPLALVAVPGYVLAATPASLAVFNTTRRGRLPPRAVAEWGLFGDDDGGGAAPWAVAASRDLSRNVYVAVATPEGRVATFHSTLPFVEPAKGWSMFGRVPIVVVGVFVALVYHKCLKRGGAGGPRRGRTVQTGDEDFLSSLPQNLREAVAKARRDKGGGGLGRHRVSPVDADYHFGGRAGMAADPWASGDDDDDDY